MANKLSLSFPKKGNCPIYAKVHPNRVQGSVEKILIEPHEVMNGSQDHKWRRELEHDAESVFWPLLYCSMVVQPEKCAEEQIDAGSWDYLNGDYKSRNSLIRTVDQRENMADNLTHSFHKPLRPLINDVAAIFVVDSHWPPEKDPRKDPHFVNEALQRLILNFIIDNRGKGFMDGPVEKPFREVQGTRRSNACSATIFQTKDAEIRESFISVGSVCGSMDYCPLLLHQHVDDQSA